VPTLGDVEGIGLDCEDSSHMSRIAPSRARLLKRSGSMVSQMERHVTLWRSSWAPAAPGSREWRNSRSTEMVPRRGREPSGFRRKAERVRDMDGTVS
jgi:hypothetical protein